MRVSLPKSFSVVLQHVRGRERNVYLVHYVSLLLFYLLSQNDYFILNLYSHLHCEKVTCLSVFSIYMYSLSGYIFSMLQIKKNRVPKPFPDITETLESHDLEMEKMIRKWGSQALLTFCLIGR